MWLEKKIVKGLKRLEGHFSGYRISPKFIFHSLIIPKSKGRAKGVFKIKIQGTNKSDYFINIQNMQ